MFKIPHVHLTNLSQYVNIYFVCSNLSIIAFIYHNLIIPLNITMCL